MHVLKMLGDSGVGDGFHLVLSYRRASGVSGQVGVAEGWGESYWFSVLLVFGIFGIWSYWCFVV